MGKKESGEGRHACRVRLVWDLIFSAEVGRIEWRDFNSRLEGRWKKWRQESERECQTLEPQ